MKKIIILALIISILLVFPSCSAITSLVCQHEFETSYVEGTCQEKGKEIRTCTKCGYQLSLDTKYGSHQFGDWEETEQATCQHTGSKKHICLLCNYEESEVTPVVDHYLEDYTIIKDASCTTDGQKTGTCIYCHQVIDNQVIKAFGHNYQATTTQSTCKVHGHIDYECSHCHDTYSEELPLLDHHFGDWKVTIAATSSSTGEEERACQSCDYVETKIIPILDYIDFSHIEANFDQNNKYHVKSYNELAFWFNVAVINKSSTIDVVADFKYGTLDELTSKLVNDCKEWSYSLSAESIGNNITFKIKYNDIATGPVSSTDAYQQYLSANVVEYSPVRDASYNDFYINKSSISMVVKDSEQLFYCLEHAANPIIESGSAVEQLYNSMKNVLRNIIDDSMTNFEKIKAIHDYLILNVCYDADLLTAMSKGYNVSSYNGFFLEGVFNDHRAVCDGISKAFTCLANMEGIPCVQVTGYPTGNPNGTGHAWNKIFLDDNWYIVDATSDGLVVNSSYEVLNYDYFLISEIRMEETYTARDFTNIICENDYDAFGSMLVPYENKLMGTTEQVSLKVVNYDQLKKVMAYYKSVYEKNMSIQIYFDDSYTCSNKAQEIIKALNAAGLSVSVYNAMEKGNKITFIRG